MAGGNFVTLGPIPDSEGGLVQGLGFGNNSISATAVTIVPAVAGKRLYIHGLFYTQNNNNTTIGFLDVTPAGATVAILNGGPNAVQGMFMNGSTPFLLPYQQYPWFTCAPGDALAVNSNGTLFIAGRVFYVQG